MVFADHQIQNPTSDDVKLNDNALHQQICNHFKADYLEEIDIIKQAKRQIEQKITVTLPALVLQYVYVGYWLEKRRSSYVLLLYVFILSAMLYILCEHAQC